MEHLSKLYTDDNVRFPVRSRNGNQNIMISYHFDSNTTISAPFNSRSDKHRLLAYGTIMQRLKNHNILAHLQILDNESSTTYKRIIKSEWVVGYQLLPPNIHCRNSAERAICTFKAHFLSTLAGISPTSPKNLWYLILPQTDLILNLLRQLTLDPKILAW